MTAIHWLTDINGSFTNASDWSGGAVPGPSDDAILDAVGNTPYTVTASANVSVSSIQLASEATLSITGGTFAAAQGTGSGANAGIILVAPQATLTAGGQIANSGSIQIGNASAGGSLLLSDYVTFSGRGQIELGASGHSHIDGNPYGVLVNLDNTISGSGTLGSGRGEFNLFNESAGVIDADATKPLVVYNLTNHGLAEATGQGGLTIKHSLFPPGYNGTFDVENDSTMQFYYSGIQGTLVSDGSGIFMGSRDVFADFSLQGNLLIYGYVGNALGGSIHNAGTINMKADSAVGIANDCVLSGGGSIILGSGAELTGSIDRNTWINVDNTILGDGFIDNMILINESNGLIDGGGDSSFLAEDSATIENAGIIESTGVHSVNLECSLENSGLILASGGTLTLGRSSFELSLANTGTIEATGGGTIVIENSIANAGTLAVQAGGTLTVDGAVHGDGGVVVIDGGTVVFMSKFQESVIFTGAGMLELAQSQSFHKTVRGFSRFGKSELDLRDIGFISASEATFSGTSSSGVLTVTDGTHTAEITLKGDYLGSTFVASSDGAGGTDIVAQKAKGAASAQGFVAAMAGFGAAVGLVVRAGEPTRAHEMLLVSPRVAIA